MFLLAHTLAAQLFLLLLNVPAAEQESVQQSQKEELCHHMHASPFWKEPNLPLYPVQQLQKQRALACGQSRGCPS